MIVVQITLIFFRFFIICVNLCNLWAYFHGSSWPLLVFYVLLLSVFILKGM
jgi:hypothetical protein